MFYKIFRANSTIDDYSNCLSVGKRNQNKFYSYLTLPYHIHVSIVLKSGSLNLLETPGLSKPVQGLL